MAGSYIIASATQESPHQSFLQPDSFNEGGDDTLVVLQIIERQPPSLTVFQPS
ncbi:MAG: hypothetical protein WAW75_04880 [Gallionella sp.]